MFFFTTRQEFKNRGNKRGLGKMKRENSPGEKRVVPEGLKAWFMVHFYVDLIVAVPLFFFPEVTLNYLGWQSPDPFTTRLFAAALFGIGISSLLVKKASIEVYEKMLNLKIIWSTFAGLGLFLSILQVEGSKPFGVWAALVVFVFFNLLWIFWKSKLE